MRTTKLTLSMTEQIVADGKAFAKRQGTSLSKLIEKLLAEHIKEKAYQPLIVTEMDEDLGALFPIRMTLPDDYDVKRDVTDYYEAKFQEYLNIEEE